MSQSQQPEIFESALNGWMVLAGDVNATLTMPTSTAANSCIGFISAETANMEIDNKIIDLTKHKTGADNPVESLSAGQTFAFNFNFQALAKSTIAIMLADNCTKTGVSAATPESGTLSGRSESGRRLKQYRMVFVPSYSKKDGTWIDTAGATNLYTIEIPKASPIMSFNANFETDQFTNYDVEIKANALLDGNPHWKLGEVDLVVE